jgi:peptidoglycan/LPS O-acetylase OafA/YrhL
MSGVRQILALTSIRGLAAWWVVLYHFRERLPFYKLPVVGPFLDHGYLAVDLFFILSGFVIFLNYSPSFSGTFSIPAARQFFVARFARIYPLYAFVTFLFLVNPIAILWFSSAHSLGPRYDPSYFVMSVFLVQNWGFTRDLAWNIPAWSISTEWFAYMVFPFATVLLARMNGKTRGTIAVMVALLAAVAAIFGLSGLSSLGQGIPSLGLPRCVLEFLIGVGIARLHLSGSLTTGIATAALAGFAVLCLIYVSFYVADFVVMPAAFALLIIGLAVERSPLAPLFEARLLVYLGTISYSTYLVHYFILDWVKFTLVVANQSNHLAAAVYLAAVLAASAALYHFVELPGRRVIRGATALRLQGAR